MLTLTLKNVITRGAVFVGAVVSLAACASAAEPSSTESELALKHAAYTIDHSPNGGTVQEMAACESTCCVVGPTTGVKFCCDWGASGGANTCGYRQ